MSVPIFFAVAVSALLLSSSAIADLVLTPDTIVFRSDSASKTMVLTRDGVPVPPDEILKITSGVLKHGDAAPEGAKDGRHFSNYSFMFDFKAGENGVITVTPKPETMSIGTYTLYVQTTHGTATGVIDATLRDQHPIAPHLKARKPAFSYGIVLPDYPHGTEISVSLTPDNKNTYFWYINGEEHSSGLGLTSFRARLEPGTYEISFIAKNADGDVVSEWSDITEVFVQK